MKSHDHSCCRRKAAARKTLLASASSLAMILAFIGGCDDRPIIPTTPPPPAATQETPAASRPTTQELQTAPRKRLTLASFPLTLEVPPGWKIESSGSGVWLEGDAPHGDVRILLAPQGATLKLESMNAMDRDARSKAASQPATLEVIPLKAINPPGNVQKMEKREIIRHLPIMREDNKVEYVDRVEWSVYVFVPQGNGFGVDVLNFSGLSLEQYQADREFLEHIIRSMRYEAVPGALLD